MNANRKFFMNSSWVSGPVVNGDLPASCHQDACGARIAGLHSPARSLPMLTNEDLAALLPRVALGDRAAFERVYRATCAHLLGVAFRILNNRERAEEVLQEAFMNVWHSVGGFDAAGGGKDRKRGV